MATVTFTEEINITATEDIHPVDFVWKMKQKIFAEFPDFGYYYTDYEDTLAVPLRFDTKGKTTRTIFEVNNVG
jgi:hypothetical protein